MRISRSLRRVSNAFKEFSPIFCRQRKAIKQNTFGNLSVSVKDEHGNSVGKSLSHVRLFVTSWTVACTKLLHPWDFLGKNTGVGCRFLLQGISPTPVSNPGLPSCRQTLYRLSQQVSPWKECRPPVNT